MPEIMKFVSLQRRECFTILQNHAAEPLDLFRLIWTYFILTFMSKHHSIHTTGCHSQNQYCLDILTPVMWQLPTDDERDTGQEEVT